MSELLDIATALPDGPTTASRSKRSSSTRPRPRFAPTRARSSPSPEQSLRVSVFGSSSTASRATPMPAPSTTRRCRRPSARPATTPRSPNPTSSTVSPCPMASNQRRSNCGVTPSGRSRPRTRSPWRSSSSGRRSQPTPGSRVSSRPNTSTLRTSRRLPPRRVSPLRPERPVATSPCTRSPKPTARPRPVSGSRSAATRVNLTRPSPPPMPPTGPLGFLGRRSQGANGSPSCSTRG